MNKSILILNDIHFPYHSRKCMDIIYQIIKCEHFDHIVLNGDICDFYDISLFLKDKARLGSLQEEINHAKNFFKHLRRNHSGEITWLLGNHEKRLNLYLKNNPELASLDALEFENLFNTEEMDINIVHYQDECRDNYVEINNVLIGHFNKVSKHSGYTVKSLMDDNPGYHIVQAHVHRMGIHCRKGYIGIESGCLCDITKCNYMKNPNWQNGFAVINITVKGSVHPEVVFINNSRCLFRGKEFISKM